LIGEEPVFTLLDRDGREAGRFRVAGGEVEKIEGGVPAPSLEEEAPVEVVEREEPAAPAPPAPVRPLRERIDALHPWFHPLRIREHAVVPGIGSTLSAEAIEYQTASRAKLLVDGVGERLDLRGKSVLDLGCGDGYWSARYAEKGAKRVLGIDGRRFCCDQAELYFFENGFLPRGHARFFEGNVSEASAWEEIRGEGPFDVTLLAGILHHIPNYREVLDRAADVTRDALVIDTRVGDPEERVTEEPGDLLFNAIEATRAKVVPSRERLLAHLESLGFDCEVLPVEFPSGPGVQHADSYEQGRRIAILARKRG